MGRRELADKILLSQTEEVTAEAFAAGSLTDPQARAVEETAQKVSPLPLYIDDNPKLTVGNITAKARLLKKQGKCRMVIIDYLQLITPTTRQGRNREQEVSEMSRLLKIAAKDLKVPILVLCQMNRDIEGENREPRLSDLRESGAIEQDADIVLFIQRNGMYVKQVLDEQTGIDITNRIELFVRKNRTGQLGVAYVGHNPNMTHFFDWHFAAELPP
jgi:replicative DNA helicase